MRRRPVMFKHLRRYFQSKSCIFCVELRENQPQDRGPKTRINDQLPSGSLAQKPNTRESIRGISRNCSSHNPHQRRPPWRARRWRGSRGKQTERDPQRVRSLRNDIAVNLAGLQLLAAYGTRPARFSQAGSRPGSHSHPEGLSTARKTTSKACALSVSTKF